MNLNRIKSLFWGLLFFTPCFVSAAAPAKSGAGIEFTCVASQMPENEPVFYRQGKQVAPLEFRNLRRSAVYKLEPTTRFDLVGVKKGEDGASVYHLLGSAPLPADWKKILFLIEPAVAGQENAPPFEIVPLNDSLEEFPAGSFRFLNTTRESLRIRCDREERMLPPGQTTVIKLPGKEEGFFPVTIFGPNNKQLFGSRLFWEPAVRELVVILPPTPENPQKLRFRFLSEIYTAPKP
jgi:hypothetical protein